VTEHKHVWVWASNPLILDQVCFDCGEPRLILTEILEAESGHTNVQAPPAIVAPEAAGEAISEETLVKIAKASKPGTSPRHWLYLRKKAARKVKAESRRKNRR
jgi:hypothetical protein